MRIRAAATIVFAAIMVVSCGSSPAAQHPGPAPLNLVAITDGLPDSLNLEWTGGPDYVISWEYRTREWRRSMPQTWGDWVSVPGGSSGNSHTFRLTGLRTPAGYDVQVRPRLGSRTGEPSNIAAGITASVGNREISPGQLVDGDGLTAWRHHGLSRTFIIPDGMRLRGGDAFIDGGCSPGGVGLSEVTTGSSITFCTDFVCEKGRRIPADSDNRDVEEFFDSLSYLHCQFWLEDATNKGGSLGLAAGGVAAIAVYTLAVWWLLRRS